MKYRTAPSARKVGAAIPPGRIGERSAHEQFEPVEKAALLQQKVAALQSDVTALRNEREMVLPRGTTVPHGLDDTGPLTQATEAEMHAQRKREEERIFSQIGNSFSAQPIDRVWSELITGRINEQMFAQPLEKSNVENVECRSSVCRIEISIHDGADLATIRDNFRVRMTDVMGSGASKQDETGKFIIYLAKDPQALGMTAQP
jgi:hypothetical protein